MSAVEVELYRMAQDDPRLARRMLDVFSRSARPSDVLTAGRSARVVARALRRAGNDRVATLAAAAHDVRTALADWRERRPLRKTTDRQSVVPG
jgi:menaquinone-9 beta-reductase